jgi:hypothetical protein
MAAHVGRSTIEDVTSTTKLFCSQVLGARDRGKAALAHKLPVGHSRLPVRRLQHGKLTKQTNILLQESECEVATELCLPELLSLLFFCRVSNVTGEEVRYHKLRAYGSLVYQTLTNNFWIAQLSSTHWTIDALFAPWPLLNCSGTERVHIKSC